MYKKTKPRVGIERKNLHIHWYIPDVGSGTRTRETYYWGRILCTASKVLDFGAEATCSTQKQAPRLGHWVVFADKDYMWLSEWALSQVGYVEKYLVPADVVQQLDRLFADLGTQNDMTKSLKKKLQNRMDDVGAFISVS